MLSAGDIVERYEVERVIGTGGMATVYAAKHCLLGSRHALKVLRSQTELTAQQLIREGQIQARIDPEYVLPVTDVVMVDGAPALIMPFVDGCSLADVLRTYRLTESEVTSVFYAIVKGVAAAHELSIMHLDLKPSNVLLDIRHGRVRARVADFGLARTLDETALSSDVFMGTPGYAAPEQFVAPDTVDARADLWALGSVLVHMLTGVPPYRGASPVETYTLMQEARDFASLPPQWRNVAQGLLYPDLSQRWSIIRQVEDVLEELAPQYSTDGHSPLVDIIQRERRRLLAESLQPKELQETRQEKRSTPGARTELPRRAGTVMTPKLPNVTVSAADLARAVTSQDTRAQDEPSVLPVMRDEFIGRADELLKLQHILDGSCRLVTVSGMGGAGKTRFAAVCENSGPQLGGRDRIL